MKNSLKLRLALVGMFGVFLSVFCAIPVMAGVAVSFLGSMAPTGGVYTSISVTALNTALGAYLREHKDILISETLLDVPFEDKFEVWDDVKDEVPMPRLTITDIVKPGLDKSTFSGTANALAFGARIGKVRDCKVDLVLIPLVLEKTWLGIKNKKGVGGEKQLQMPFEEYIFRYIIKKAKENIHLNAIYKGIYNAAGTTPIDTMDGMLKMIADEITAGSMTPIVTGAITSANVYDKLLLVYDGLDEAYKQGPTQMTVSSQVFDWYIRKFNPIVNTSLVGADALGMQDIPLLNMAPLYGTNCTIKREAGVGTSQRVWVTQKENQVYMVDSLSDSGEIMTQIHDRTIRLYMDFKTGVQLKEVNDKAIRCNDQV